jgi:hypothetical protein
VMMPLLFISRMWPLDLGVPHPEFCPKPELSPLLYTYDPFKRALPRALFPWEVQEIVTLARQVVHPLSTVQ